MSPEELFDARCNLGLTQIELAAQLGVHEMTVSRWERGTRAIPSYLPLALQQLQDRDSNATPEGLPAPY